MDSALSSTSTNPVQNKAIYTALAGKQSTLTFDSTPTSGSSNPVTSGGIYTAISNKMDKVTSVGSSSKPIYINSSGVPTACSYSIGTAASYGVTTSVISGSSSLVTSGAVYNAINESSGSKSVYAGTLASLFSISGSSFTVEKEFDIEYIYYGKNYVLSTRVTVGPFTLNWSNTSDSKNIALGQGALLSHFDTSFWYRMEIHMYINSSGSISKQGVYSRRIENNSVYSSEECVQLTSNSIPSSYAYKFLYRLWV